MIIISIVFLSILNLRPEVIVLIIILIVRNLYNVSKKRAFKKKLKSEIEKHKAIVDKYNEQAPQIEELGSKLQIKIEEIDTLKIEHELTIKKLQDAISFKDKEIEKEIEKFNHQGNAYEKYIDYKNIDIDNTRLGPHFIKNIITQIYQDLDKKEPSYIKILGFKFNVNQSNHKIPSIKALKDIFKLLDYNVAGAKEDAICINKELNQVNVFLELIKYLKPNAKIELKNSLNINDDNEIMIKPTLLFPFIENALKHGNLNNHDSFVLVSLKKNNEKQLTYSIINSVESRNDNNTTLESESNFGLSAFNKLVKAHYPGSSLFHKELENNQYLSELTINLN